MSLVSLDYFKTFLKITATTDDAFNQICLDMASASVVAAIGVDVLQTTYPAAAESGRGDSGYYSGNGSRLLILRNWPVTAVASVYLDPTGRFDENPDGSFAAATLLTYGTDYVIRWDGCLPGTTTKCSKQGIIERVGSCWPGGVAYVRGMLTRQPIPAMGNIKVAYTAGYPSTAIPYPIREAVCMLAAYIRRNNRTGGNIQSESQGGYSYSLSSPMAGQYPELASIRGTLAPFREQAV